MMSRNEHVAHMAFLYGFWMKPLKKDALSLITKLKESLKRFRNKTKKTNMLC